MQIINVTVIHKIPHRKTLYKKRKRKVDLAVREDTGHELTRKCSTFAALDRNNTKVRDKFLLVCVSPGQG